MPAESNSKPSILRLILIPAVITLGVTVLRLVGELQHWNPKLFNREAGGPGALIGIVWLGPIFAIYFAIKLAKAGHRPEKMAATFGLFVLGVILYLGGGFVGFATQPITMVRACLGMLIMGIAGAIQYFGWRDLFKVLVAYAYAARVPVIIVMFFAIQGNWGTHYDATDPAVMALGFWPRYILTALMPQLILWIAFTLLLGTLFGGIAALFVKPAGSPLVARAAAR